MPGTWRLRKKKAHSLHSKSKHRDVYRSRSSKEISLHSTTTTTTTTTTTPATPPRRTATISGVPVRSKSATNINCVCISPENYTIEKFGKSRTTLACESQDFTTNIPQDFLSTELSSNLITVSFDDGHKSFEQRAVVQESMTLQNVLAITCCEQGMVLANNLTNFSITALDVNGIQCIVDLNAPSTNYMDNTIEVRSHDSLQLEEATTCPDKMTVQFCLDFFDRHGIVDIPCNQNEDDDSSRLPRVQPSQPIFETSWDELPINIDMKQSLDSIELAGQQAIWELIQTEHSFLKQLEIIVNIYMRSLELIRRQDLLTEVNYHNIFGYMEEIHSVHKRFWSSTLSPCLERVYLENCPLDISDVILNFPSDFANDFDIYEQHCAFETTNLRSLNEAMNHADFRAYVKWCEAQPECNRLRLKDFLAIPRQRLMKYQLLFHAILKKTTDQSSSDKLKQIIENVSMFVDSVNNVLKTQEESSRVEEVMKKITGYSPVEIPSDLKELVQPHTHLDLMAPMPDVDITKTRILVLEGKLRFRDQKDKMVVHVFLFSDMLLISKPTVKRNVENYIVVRPPYKISNIQVTLRGDAICCIVLSEFKVLSTLFTLKAHSPGIAKEWVDQITSAQDFYNSALTKKIPTWHILQSLRQERILHGVSQDIFCSEPVESKVRAGSPQFKRVASNDSILSSNSSSAFPFDIKSPSSPLTKRRGTIPCCHSLSDTSKTFRRNSNVPYSPPWLSSTSGTSPPVWQRTSSLNALPEKNIKLYTGSPKLPNNSVLDSIEHFSCHRTASLNLLSGSPSSNIHCIDPLIDTTCPMLEEAVPLQESDSNTDDEDQYMTPHSPVNSVFSPTVNDDPLPTFRKHRRHKSQPTNTYTINTDLLNRQSESDDSVYSLQKVPIQQKLSEHEEDMLASSDSCSLMNDIIQELSKTNTEVSTKFQEEIDKSEDTFNSNIHDMRRQRSMSLHSSVGSSLEKRFHTRRKAIQLDNIFEISDEESDTKNYDSYSKTDSTYFTRNTKLRRSKSSFELSFHRRVKPPSPLITHMKRSTERISDHPKLKVQTSSPILVAPRLEDTYFQATKISDEPKQLRKCSLEEREIKKVKDKKKKTFSFFKKGKSLSPTHNKWGFKGLKKFTAVSMETGLDSAEDTSLLPSLPAYHKKDTSPPSSAIPYSKEDASPLSSSLPYSKEYTSPVSSSLPYSSSPLSSSLPYSKEDTSSLSSSLPYSKEDTSPRSLSLPYSKEDTSPVSSSLPYSSSLPSSSLPYSKNVTSPLSSSLHVPKSKKDIACLSSLPPQPKSTRTRKHSPKVMLVITSKNRKA